MNSKTLLVPNQSILRMNKNISVNCKFYYFISFCSFFIFNLLMILILKYNILHDKKKKEIKIKTYKKNDINTIDKAKEYSNYYGGVLKPEEKAIFDSNLLKPNGTLDKALLQHTAEVLDN